MNKTLEIEPGTVYISASQLGSFDGFTRVIIPDSVTLIDDGAFRHINPEEIVYGNGIKRIDTEANGCDNLKRVKIPDSVVGIMEYAFAGCHRLENVTIGANVEYIGQNAFLGCNNLVELSVSNKNNWLGIFIGLFVQGLLTLFALGALNDREENLAIAGGGFVVWLWFGIRFVYAFIAKTTRRVKNKALVICPDGKIRYIDSNKAGDFFDEHKDYSFASFEKFAEQENWKISDWDKKYQFSSCANVRYAPKKVWSRYEKLK